MKILYVINQISDWSGDSGLLWLSAKLLQKRGHDISIATTDGNPFRDNASIKKYSETAKKLKESKEKVTEINNIPIYPIHSISSYFNQKIIPIREKRTEA